MNVSKRVSELTPYEDCNMAKMYIRGTYEFAKALQKTIRGIKFGKVGDREEVHVYTEGQPFTMGYIGYGDWRYSGSKSIDYYNVVSSNITNDKYSSGNARHLKMSTKLDVALKTARRFFRNLTPEQMANNEARGIRNSYHDIRDTLRKDKDAKRQLLFEGNLVTSEFRHMLQQGYEFIDQRFGAEVRAYITLIDELESAVAKKLDVAFVRVFEKFGEQTFQVVNMYDVQKASYFKPPMDAAVEYNDKTLPEELMGKLSALNMLQKGNYVEGVGFNSGDGLFYVTL